MTHETIPRTCTPAEFLAMEPHDRILTVRRHIRDFPETWHQKDWMYNADLDNADADDEVWIRWEAEVDKPTEERNLCGTAFCFGGWGCVYAGDRFVGGETVARDRNFLTVEVNDVVDRANNLFGINDDSHYLYYETNDLEDLDEAITNILLDQGYRYDPETITAEPS